MSNIPIDAIKVLTNLEELDFSNNKLKIMQDTSFHFLKKLQILELHDNMIEEVPKGTFQVRKYQHQFPQIATLYNFSLPGRYTYRS